MKTLLAFFGGCCMGAAAMYMMDPTRGQTRQARVRDQVASKVNDTQESVEGYLRHLSNKYRGLRHGIGDRVGAAAASIGLTREQLGMSSIGLEETQRSSQGIDPQQ